MRDLYTTGEYLQKTGDWHAHRAEWKARQVLIGIAAAKLEPKSLCDIGCGTGLILADVARSLSVDRAVGFEPSPDAPFDADAAKKVILRRQAVQESVGEHYDAALMLDVFEHVEDYFELIRAAARIATYVIFHIPLDINILTVLNNGGMGPRRALGHIHQFSPETAIATINDCGMSVLHTHFTKAGFEGAGRQRNAPLNLARRCVMTVSPKMCQRLLGGVGLLVVAKSR